MRETEGGNKQRIEEKRIWESVLKMVVIETVVAYDWEFAA